MLISLLLSLEVLSISIESIPETGSSPISKMGSAAIYDAETNSIITIGGEKFTDGSIDSEIDSFNLTSLKWDSRIPISEYIPKMIIYHGMHLRNDRKLLVFGYFSEVFLLDLDGFSWARTELKGDKIYDPRYYAYTSMYFNNTDYFVLFGGLCSFGYVNTLTLIDVDKLVAKTLKNNGTPPSPRNGATISFYNNSLYVYGYSISEVAKGKESGSELFRYDLLDEYWEVVKTNGEPPGPRQFHYSCIYKDELYIFYGLLPEYALSIKSIFKFNFKSTLWTYLTSNPVHTNYASATLLIENKFFFIYGRDLISFLNSVTFIDLSKSQFIPEYLSKDWTSPSARVFHCSFVVNQNMYIFAGSSVDVSVNLKYFNDMWTFSFVDNLWSSVQMFGNVPSERGSFASVMMSGNVLVLFGGIGINGFLNDLYYFQETRKKWVLIQPGNYGPTGRADSCLAFHDNVVYIIGGRNDAGGLSEIWLYSFLTNEYTLHPAKIGGTSQFYIKNIQHTKCWVEDSENHLKLTIIGGSDSNAYPNEDLIHLNLYKNGSYSIELRKISNIIMQAIVGSETSSIKYGNYLIRLGGTIFRSVVLTQAFVFDLENASFLPLNLTFNFFGHSAVHYKKSIYVFGGAASIELYRVTNMLKSQLLKITFDENDSFSIGCSPGTFLSDCQPCEKGTFYSNGTCNNCPPGKFNDLIASTSLDQCLPCPAGYFTNQQGSTKCRQCESSFNCPVGAVNPKKITDLERNSSVQPKPYKNKKNFISEIVGNLWIFSAVVCGVVGVFSFFFGDIWKILRKVDFFVANHHNDLGVAIVHRKTSFGGLFSLFFIMVSAVTISGGFLSFTLDNITEIQALVPVISLDTSVTANFLRLEFIFYSYGGNCVENSKCSSKIKIIDDGLKSSSRYLECAYDGNDCKVTINYLTCSTIRKNAEVLLSLEEQSSYSTGLSLNITSSSSIPDEVSSVFVFFQASSNDSLLKGSKPSIFYYKFTPSVTDTQVFKSESSEWPSQETGFHIWPNQDPQIGSLVDQDSINLFLHLKAKVSITESDTAMLTQRLVNQSALAFIGTLLGSVFGLMGTVAVIMKFTESFSERYEKKKMKKVDFYEKIRKRILLDFETDSYFPSKFSNRVVPTVYEIHDD